MNDEQLRWLSLGAVVFCLGVIGGGLGSFRGRVGFGFAFGLLLGPLGWLIVLLLPSAKTDSTNPFEADKRERRRMF